MLLLLLFIAGRTGWLTSSDLLNRCAFHARDGDLLGYYRFRSWSHNHNWCWTIVNESNNWLNLSAKGFTFSTPTIQVKLSQEAPAPVPTPTPTPTVTASPDAGDLRFFGLSFWHIGQNYARPCINRL